MARFLTGLAANASHAQLQSKHEELERTLATVSDDLKELKQTNDEVCMCSVACARLIWGRLQLRLLVMGSPL